MPGVRVVQVTGMPRPLHHHHFVIGQIAQVGERQIPEIDVLVAVDDQSRNLSRRKAETLQVRENVTFKRAAERLQKLRY